MTDDTTDGPKQKPWRWPKEWLSSEKFWYDVATRATAGLIVGFAVYLVGVGSGLFQFPGVGKVTLTIVTLIVGSAIATGVFYIWVKAWNRLRKRFPSYLMQRVLYVLGVAFSLGFFLFVAYMGDVGRALINALIP